jgi:hypothetical protein
MISMGYEKDAGDPAKLCCADLPRPGKNCRPNEAGRDMDALVAPDPCHRRSGHLILIYAAPADGMNFSATPFMQ